VTSPIRRVTTPKMKPGDLLRVLLDDREMTQKELANLRQRPAQAISEIVRGKKRITPEMAVELEHELGLPAEVWLAFETTVHLMKVR
jgi:addiction module HigA family antidote